MVGAVQSPRHREAPLGRLRSGDWLTAPRARAYCLIFLGVSLVVGAAWALMSRGGVDPAGKPLGTDFTSFWSAANLALRGAPQLAYDIRVHHAVEVAIKGRDTG